MISKLFQVTIGNMHVTVGYLEYKKETEMILIISLTVGLSFVAILLLGMYMIFLCYKSLGFVCNTIVSHHL